MSKIYLETHIKAPPETVFDLARNVELHEQGSSATSERAVAGVTSGMVEMGSMVTWRATHFFREQELTVVVTEFHPPHMFADEMVRGAFKSMRHVHSFDQDGDGTLMRDVFEFECPLGILGRIADWLFLRAYMRRFLVNRNAFLKVAAERPEP